MIAADSAKARRERIAAARKKSLARVKSHRIVTSRGPGLGAVIPASPSSPRGEAPRTFARRLMPSPGRAPPAAVVGVLIRTINKAH